MKKLLAMALALLMVAVLLPVTAMAADTLPHPDAEGLIKLEEDVTLASRVNYGYQQNITIDLNGFTITGPGDFAGDIAVGVLGSLTIMDSSEAGTGTINGTIAANAAQSKVIIKGGTIKKVTTSGAGATLEISGGKIQENVSMSGYNSNMDISGGAIENLGYVNKGAEGSATVTGGTFGTIANPNYIPDNTLFVKDGEGKFHVGETAANEIAAAGEGDTFTVIKGSELTNVPVGVTITNETGNNLSVNGKEVAENDQIIIEKSKPIVIIVPDDTTDPTTTTEKPANPATGANDFVGVAAALAVVSLLGMAVASRKK